MTITAKKYTFHCQFTTEARLPGYLGSTLRGALGWALKKTSCALKRQQCVDCLLREQCAYAWIFETEQYRAGDGGTINARPHPFVLQPESTAENSQPGDDISFSLLLIDRAVAMLPQLVYAVQLMGKSGIGAGRKYSMGRFELKKVSTAEQTVYSNDQGVLHKTDTFHQIQLENHCTGEIACLQVNLLTPLRLKQGNQLKRNLPFHVLIRAGLRRIAALEEAYNGGEPDLDYQGMVRRAENVKISSSNLHWQKLYRYSNRQRKKVSLSGIGGRVEYTGELAEFLPILRYCEQVNIGKQTVFGLGKIVTSQ